MIVKLPTLVKVAPMTYMVRMVEGLAAGDGTPLLGQANSGDLEIRIEEDQPQKGRWPVLLHEVLHLVLEQAGHMEAAGDEDLIQALTYGLMNVTLDGRPLLWGLWDEDGPGAVSDRAA